MKTIKIILVAFAFLMVNNHSFSNTDNDVEVASKFGAAVQVLNDEEIILRCENTKYSNLMIQFYNVDGVLLHEKSICEKCNFKLTYSLKEIQKGEYLIKITNKNEAVYIQKFKGMYGKLFLD